MTESWLNLLGLARRAGKLAPGEHQTSLAMMGHRVALLVIATDAGAAVYRKYHLWAQDLSIPFVQMGTKASLGHAIGMGPHAVLAILDGEFGGRILEEMRKSSGGIIVDRKRERQDQGIRTGQRAQTRQPSSDRPAPSAQSGKYQKSHEHGGTRGGKDSSRHYGGEAAAGAQARSKGSSSSDKPQAQSRTELARGNPSAKRRSASASQSRPRKRTTPRK